MPRAPAICPKCDTVFASPININAPNATLTGISVTCPTCGSKACIPPGVYSALNATTLALTWGRISPEKLSQLITIFETARSSRAAPEEVVEDIKSNVPEAASLADALPKTRMELYVFLAVIIAALSLILTTCQSMGGASGLSETEVQQIVDEAINSLF